MSLNLNILLQAGFFKEHEGLSEEELLDLLNKKRKEEYSKIFEREYDPGQIKDDHQLALLDTKKFLDIDLEADVCDENRVYTSILEDFAKASNGHFSPTKIEETWESEEGPIKVSFMSNGYKVSFEPEYNDDWLDPELFDTINGEMQKVTTEIFYQCGGPNEEWLGQNMIYVRLTESEKKLLEDKLDWKFL